MNEIEIFSLHKQIEHLERILVRPEVNKLSLRETDPLIHWTLVALREFSQELEASGNYVDDLEQAAQNLAENLESNINIRVEDITGFEVWNKANNYWNSDLINDILQAAYYGGLHVEIANFLLSNMDKLDLKETRSYIDEIEG